MNKAEIQGAIRRATFLENLRKTRSATQASVLTGVTTSTPQMWKKRHPGFAEDYERALAGKPSVVVEQNMAAPEGFPTSFLEYRSACCAYLDRRTHTWVHAQNNWYQQDAYTQLQTSNRLVVILPPGHIKTTFFAIEYPTFRIMSDRDVRITVVQKNQGEARKLVSSVQDRLTDHGLYDHWAYMLEKQGDEPITNPLREWFADRPFRNATRMTGDTWGADAFKVMGRTSGEKDYTMEAKGVGGQIQGVRADLILLDDVQDPDEAVKSPQGSTDKLRWFNDVILGRVTEYQQVVVLGNYFSPEDFAHKLIDSHPEFTVVNYSALIGPELDPEIPEGETRPLCPEFWTLDALEAKRKEVGEQTWFYTWMQEHGSYEDATFKREVLEDARDPGFTPGTVPSQVTDLFLGVDPATAGFCAMVLWGLDRRTKQRYLIDVFNEKGLRNWDNVVTKVLEFTERFHPRKVIVEGNNTQKGFINSEALQRGVRSAGARLEIYQTVTGTGARAESTNFDITTIGGLFDAGLITLPYAGTYEDQSRIDAYITQLVSWRTDTSGHSVKHLLRDMVMATLFAESEAFTLASRPIKEMIQDSTRVPDWAKGRDGGFAWQPKKPSGPRSPLTARV